MLFNSYPFLLLFLPAVLLGFFGLAIARASNGRVRRVMTAAGVGANLAVLAAVQRDGRTLFLAMLIPDKLTAYSPLLADRTIAGLGVLDRLDARAASRLPVVRDLERAILAGTPDVYLPADSHLGAAGQEILARTLLDELRHLEVLPPGSKRPSTSN